MIRLAYTLKESEIRHYYQFMMSVDPHLLHERFHAASWVPMGCLIFLIFFRAPLYAWIIGILFSLVWFFWGSQLVFQDVISVSLAGKDVRNNLRKLVVCEEDGNLLVNGKKRQICGYAAYMDLLIVQLENNENLIVPGRVFAECREQEQFVRDVMAAAHQEQASLYAVRGE